MPKCTEMMQIMFETIVRFHGSLNSIWRMFTQFHTNHTFIINSVRDIYKIHISTKNKELHDIFVFS